MIWKRSLTFLSLALLSGANCTTDEAGSENTLLALLAGANPCGTSAFYRVVFTSIWSAETHGGGSQPFPANGHYSRPVGATHTQDARFWEPGTLASTGIERMAEGGNTTTISNEFAASSEVENIFVSDVGLAPSPGSLTLYFCISRERPAVTLVSMIAPSPDWFVGVSALNLLDGDTFEASKTYDLLAYDAGTDDGVTFTSADLEAIPHKPIGLITETPLHNNPLGSFRFERIY